MFEAIQPFNFGALISFCSIPLLFFLLFANYMEQLFLVWLELGDIHLFSFQFISLREKDALHNLCMDERVCVCMIRTWETFLLASIFPKPEADMRCEAQ